MSYKTLLRLYKVFGRHYKKHWKLAVAAYAGLLLTILIALCSPWPLKLILDHVVLGNPLPAQVAFLDRWLEKNYGESLPAKAPPLTPGSGEDYGEPLPDQVPSLTPGKGENSLELMLAGLVLAFILFQVLDSLFTYMHRVGMLSLGEMLVTDIREHVFAHLQRLSLSFHESARSGDLVYRLTADIHDIKTILVQVPQQFVYRLTMIVSHVGLMLLLEWRLALVAFGMVPILYYFQWRIGNRVRSAMQSKKSKESDVTSLITENATAMALVQAYGREDLQQARFASENRHSLTFEITALRLTQTFKRCGDLLMGLGTGGVVYYGGSLAFDGTILPGTLVLFVAYLKNLYKPVEKFADMLLQIATAQVAGARLLELVECDMVMQDAPDAVPAPQLTGRVEFREVSFAYQQDSDVLQHLNFVAEAGEIVALVGLSGAGKSTLLSLLLRFYDPQQGQILIDGHDIRTFTLKSLRDQMTIVMQEARLFNQTVRENLGFGKTDATMEDIVRAAKLAQAHDFIVQMPDGYETLMSEGGDNLSGGQKQRLNLARAIMRDTPILILDEPTTALDAQAEAHIHAALHELTRGKTTFIIAHKFSTIAHADKILMLEAGKPAAYGTHEALMRTSRGYRELYELQFGRQPAYTTVATDDASGASSEEACTGGS
jgi:ATP-binding cassette subfamily B protein